MAKSVGDQLKLGIGAITKRMSATLKEVLTPARQKPIADFVLSLIIKRTRLGYGVAENFGNKYSLPRHSPGYIEFRRRFADLSNTTAPRKSNLTLTGQLLQSTKVTKVTNGQIVISPTGNRRDGMSNLKLANILDGKGYTYNKISQLEYAQLIRFYRKTFGDLLKKRNLLR